VKETVLSRCFRAVALCLLHIIFASDYGEASHLGKRYRASTEARRLHPSARMRRLIDGAARALHERSF